jgi:predicted O-methyltransferase YrrM
MAGKQPIVSESVSRYIFEHSLRDNELLTELRMVTASDPLARMQVTPEVGQFLALLAQAIGARKCLEIGVFTGYSSLAVALALPPEARIVACDVNKEWTALARKYWQRAGVAHMIDLRIAPALDTLDKLIKAGEIGTFDFAFIDADKGSNLDYYERCMRLVRRGGLIAIDNTLWSGAVADPADREPDTQALRALNDRLHRDRRISLSLLPIGDGLSLALKL